MSAFRLLLGAGILAAATVLLASEAGAQATVDAETGSGVGRTFFGPAGGSGAARSGPDRWGIPRLESLRGDHRPDAERSTVPVNVNSVANGTANQPIRTSRPRRRHPLRRPTPARTVVQVNNQVTVVNGARRPERRRAVRRGEAARARAETPPARSSREARATDTRRSSAPAPASESEDRARKQWVPLVKPLAPAEKDRELEADNCASVRITTVGGIEWRHRIALDALGASSVSGAASLLQSNLRDDQPLVVESRDGGVSVPAHLVESLIVGPCR